MRVGQSFAANVYDGFEGRESCASEVSSPQWRDAMAFGRHQPAENSTSVSKAGDGLMFSSFIAPL